MMAAVRAAVLSIPDDARRVLMLAMSMPVFMWIYQVVPGLTAQRIAFSAGIGALTVLIGWLLEERNDIAGALLEMVAITVMVLAWTALAVAAFVGADALITALVWRGMAGIQQAVMVVGWCVLWCVLHRPYKWLSRSAAGAASLVSMAGLIWFLHVNFGLADPLLDPAQWRLDFPSGVGARTASVWVEPVMAVSLWGFLLWRGWHWWRRQRHGRHRGG